MWGRRSGFRAFRMWGRSRRVAAYCLASAGLFNPHVVSQGETVALSPAVGQQVFVDGPFKTRADAASSAASLNGIETVATAGLYVVSAKASAHLQAKVSAVASCLKSTKGQGSLTF